jgi:hypothetical protein
MLKEKLVFAKEALAAYKQAIDVGKDDLSQSVKQKIETAIERLSR